LLFDDLGFVTEYSVETEIEFPAHGDWGFPEIRVRDNGLVFGGPLAVVSPAASEPWVLVSDLQNIGTLYATPNPRLLCLVNRFVSVIVIDVDHPNDQTQLDVADPLSVAGAPDLGLLLLGDEQRVTAFGVGGRGWQSKPIFDYDLRIRRTDNERIVCRGWFHDATAPVEVTLDAHTGEVISQG
jgi:hypothetical protein